jgi:hypothetical protein
MAIAAAPMLDYSRSGRHRAYSRCLIKLIARRRRVHEAASRVDDHAELCLSGQGWRCEILAVMWGRSQPMDVCTC